ncbi:MAG: hypothetical protein ACI8RZ_006186, partial [Myxococcota bacterium]
GEAYRIIAVASLASRVFNQPEEWGQIGHGGGDSLS